ncbi:MAG: hypothetical protein ABI210_14855 [Abditibacteriaceae bacterium]
MQRLQFYKWLFSFGDGIYSGGCAHAWTMLPEIGAAQKYFWIHLCKMPISDAGLLKPLKVFLQLTRLPLRLENPSTAIIFKNGFSEV